MTADLRHLHLLQCNLFHGILKDQNGWSSDQAEPGRYFRYKEKWEWREVNIIQHSFSCYFCFFLTPIPEKARVSSPQRC